LPTSTEIIHGIPQFLDQLTDTLRQEAASGSQPAGDGPIVAGEVRERPRLTEIDTTAGRHGNELLLGGYTVDQVVHDYGDLCQAVTELALEENAAITTAEFRTLNRCLDNAIADAVTGFERQRDHRISDANAEALSIRLGLLAHELNTLTMNAILSVAAIRKGHVGVAGATGAVLDRSLMRLRALVDRTLVDVRLTAGMPERRERLALSEFIADAQVVAAMEAESQGLELIVTPVDPGLAVEADRQILAGALANLLHNALKFSRPHGRIVLRAYSIADRILIDVEDECGGLPAPAEHVSVESKGLGLGLVISRRAIEANGGLLRVRNHVGRGCVFCIDLPRTPGRAVSSSNA